MGFYEMKYVKQFEKYITDERVDTKRLTEEEFIELFKQNCKTYDFNEHFKLSRNIGLKDDLYKINPMLYKRKSISDVPNIYTLIMDNEPMWKDYPKRSHALIGYLEPESSYWASGHFTVIPYDGAKLGICLKNGDIWGIWNKRVEKILGVGSVSGFLEMLESIKVGLDSQNFNDDDIEKLKEELATLEEYIMNHTIDEVYAISLATPFTKRYFSDILHELKQNILKAGSLYKFMCNLYSPLKNFKSVDMLSINLLDKRDISPTSGMTRVEFWTNSECLLVPTSQWSKLKSKLRN